ncbi:MAG: indolepyruvate/phenylpyruvate decarboxylase [Betaproteobacteria bacterium]|nr:indolepyruvate/phenylpyruvate decarboxylase [Betaproteobacteria bacterium]
MNLAESLLIALKAHGARQIFGIPGDFVLPFFKVIEESAILPLYTLSHEPAVGFAADAAARISGAPGVAVVTYGAGALNMVNAVAGAYAEKSPLVVISGGPGRGESGSGWLLHHQAKRLDSQLQIYREITCDQTRLDDAARAPGAIARVLASCIRETRPVYIEVPRDMPNVPCAPVTPDVPAPIDTDALTACVTEILERLSRASQPVLMVGVEVRRFGQEEAVAKLAARLRIPVVTSFMGCGLLAESANPALGAYLGMAGRPEVTELVENADALFLLGVILSDTNFGISQRQIDLRHTIHANDREVTLGYHTYSDIPLAALIAALLERTAIKWTPAYASDKACTQPVPCPAGLVADDHTIAPDDIARAINDLMARHGRMPLAVDVGDCLFTSMDIDHTHRVAPGYYATMGFGVPAGLGLQAASGRRALILVGDGAFQMTGWELGNCPRYGWDPIVVVFNNAGWGMLQSFQPESAFNHLGEWNFASMAAGMGGDGMRARTRAELADALAQAVATRGKFQLIEAMIPSGELSSTLKRYVAGVRRVSAEKSPLR